MSMCYWLYDQVCLLIYIDLYSTPNMSEYLSVKGYQFGFFYQIFY